MIIRYENFELKPSEGLFWDVYENIKSSKKFIEENGVRKKVDTDDGFEYQTSVCYGVTFEYALERILKRIIERDARVVSFEEYLIKYTEGRLGLEKTIREILEIKV